MAPTNRLADEERRLRLYGASLSHKLSARPVGRNQTRPTGAALSIPRGVPPRPTGTARGVPTPAFGGNRRRAAPCAA
jgi:hypothetical protein